MMNALPILTEGPPLAGPGNMSDSPGLSGASKLLGRSGDFKDVMAKANAVSGVGTSLGQLDKGPADTGPVVTQVNAAITNGVAAEAGLVKTAQMPDEIQLRQLAALVQQLPQDVQQILTQAVNQGDWKRLQLIFQGIQAAGKPLFNGTSDMSDETQAAVEAHFANGEGVRTGPMDMQEAQKLALAIWLMSFVRPLTQGEGSGMAPVFELKTGDLASVNRGQTVASSALEGDSAQWNSRSVSSLPNDLLPADLLNNLRAAALNKDSTELRSVLERMIQGPATVASSALEGDSAQWNSRSVSSLPNDLLSADLLNNLRAAALNKDSTELRSVLERMLQGPATVASSTAEGDSAQWNSRSVSSGSNDFLPADLLNNLRAAALNKDSTELRSVLERMLQGQLTVASGPSAETNVLADFHSIKITDSLEMSVNKDIVDAEKVVSGSDSDALTPGEPMAVPFAGANQEKSAHVRGKQAVFADLNESLKNLSKGSTENKEVQQGQGESLSSLQAGTFENEMPQPSDQNAGDRPLNNSLDLQQVTGNQRTEFRETVVIRRNVPVHAVTKEVEGVISKGLEQGQMLPRRVVLYLDPPELGRVRVNMVLTSENQLSVNFVAEHASVRTVLEGHMEQLRGQLVQKGMEVSNLRVEAGGFADFASLDQGFQQNTPQERWASFKGDWSGIFSAKNMAEEETRQAAHIFKPNANGRLHLII